MPTVRLDDDEIKLLTAVIDEMKTLPDIDYQNVANRINITYGRNAKTKLSKLWAKLKSPVGNNEIIEGDEDEDNAVELAAPLKPVAVVEPALAVKSIKSAKKPIAKKSAAATKDAAKGATMTDAPKEALVEKNHSGIKKGVAKITGPIKASQGGPKRRATTRSASRRMVQEAAEQERATVEAISEGVEENAYGNSTAPEALVQTIVKNLKSLN